MQTINGTTYWEFPPTDWGYVNAQGVLAPLASTAVPLFADKARTPAGTLSLSGQAWTPTTDASGTLPGFLAPQYDDIFGDGGAGLKAIRSTDIAEKIDAVAAAATTAGLTAEDVRDIIGAALRAGSGVTVNADDAVDTITISSSATPGADNLRALSDFLIPATGTPRGTVPMVDANGALAAGGVSVFVRDAGASTSDLPNGSIVWFRAAGTPGLSYQYRHTLAVGASGSAVDATAEGYQFGSVAQAAYVTDRPSGVTGTTSAEFAPGSIRYYETSGLTDTTTYARFFVKYTSITANSGLYEIRSETGGLANLQLQPGGLLAVKNIGATVYTTPALTANTWYRVDGQLGNSSQRWRVYAGNGTTVFADSGAVAAGAGAPSRHRIGMPLAGTSGATFRVAAHDIASVALTAPWAA